MALFSLFMMFIRTYYSPRHGRAARHGVQPPGTPGDRRLKNREKSKRHGMAAAHPYRASKCTMNASVNRHS